MTRSHRAPSRKDANHDEIARAMARVAIVIDTHASPEIGADLLVLSRGRVFFVEIKDGAKPPSARKLTTLESTRRAECLAASVTYVIVRDIDEAMCAVAIKRCAEWERLWRPHAITSLIKCGCGTLDGPARFRK